MIANLDSISFDNELRDTAEELRLAELLDLQSRFPNVAPMIPPKGNSIAVQPRHTHFHPLPPSPIPTLLLRSRDALRTRAHRGRATVIIAHDQLTAMQQRVDRVIRHDLRRMARQRTEATQRLKIEAAMAAGRRREAMVQSWRFYEKQWKSLLSAASSRKPTTAPFTFNDFPWPIARTFPATTTANTYPPKPTPITLEDLTPHAIRAFVFSTRSPNMTRDERHRAAMARWHSHGGKASIAIPVLYKRRLVVREDDRKIREGLKRVILALADRSAMELEEWPDNSEYSMVGA